MRKYESLFIFHPELKEEKLKKKIDEIKKYITSKKGKVEDIKENGRVNLAFPIKKYSEGIHTVFNFEVSPDIIDQFKKKFLKDEKVLRYTVLRK